ncbi:MAG: hypothetical protein KW804_01100 [Candidatus Doudnabacteria bacterium]|nr:hypothetical protein [Candidatus Doudnabacteria bacterium]
MPFKVKVGIAICLLLLLAVLGFSYFQRDADKYPKEVSRNLTNEDRKIFEDRLAESRFKAETTSGEEKFGWQMQVGYNLSALGKLYDAENAFKQAIELKPDEQTGYSALFQVQYDRGNYEEANKNIKTAIEKDEKNPDLRRKYIFLQQDKLNASNEKLDQLYIEALRATDSNVDIITVYAEYLERVGNLPKAIEYWKQAITLNSKNKALYQAEIVRIEKLVK